MWILPRRKPERGNSGCASGLVICIIGLPALAMMNGLSLVHSWLAGNWVGGGAEIGAGGLTPLGQHLVERSAGTREGAQLGAGGGRIGGGLEQVEQAEQLGLRNDECRRAHACAAAAAAAAGSAGQSGQPGFL